MAVAIPPRYILHSRKAKRDRRKDIVPWGGSAFILGKIIPPHGFWLYVIGQNFVIWPVLAAAELAYEIPVES